MSTHAESHSFPRGSHSAPARVKTMPQMIDKIDNGGLKRAYAGGQEEEQQKEKQKEFPKARLDAQIGAVD
jgi:hypothetical protein